MLWPINNWFWLSYFSVNREALIGLLNGCIISSLGFLTGYMVFATYSVNIFQLSGASIDPYLSSIAFAFLQMIGNLCTARFSDTLGRKLLLIISYSGAAFGLFTFSVYTYIAHLGYDVADFDWIPVTSLSFVIFIASCGSVPLMFLTMVEQLPPKVSLDRLFYQSQIEII